MNNFNSLKLKKSQSVIYEDTKKPFSSQTLIGGAIIFMVLVGFGVAISVHSCSHEDQSKRSMWERAKNGDEADIYRVKKIQRNGDDLNYVMRMRKEDNLSSNKYHPTKAAQAVSTRK